MYMYTIGKEFDTSHITLYSYVRVQFYLSHMTHSHTAYQDFIYYLDK